MLHTKNYNISGFIFSTMKDYHLEFIVKKCIEQRGFPEIIDNDPFVDPYPEQPLGYFIVQMDKSTCQTYNLKNNFLDIGAFPRLKQNCFLRKSLKSMEFSFWWFLKRLTFLMSTDVMRFFILYKRSECEAFLLRSVQIISFGIGNVCVMRFVTIP